MATENKDIVIYKSEDGQIAFNVNVFEDTVWLTQKEMAELFDRNRVAITQHIGNIFKEGELKEKLVCKDFLHTTQHGAITGKTQNKSTKYYNLDVIISVGYRVKSQRGIEFRRWATSILKQYLVNGYAINERRIKAIEERIDKLSSEYSDLKKEFKAEINKINQNLIQIANRPINITNQINIASHNLEKKIIRLIDELIEKLEDDKSINQLEELKQDITALPKDQKTKAKIIKFFTKLGDHDSDLNKTIQGAKISKNVIIELIKLGAKLKDIFF